MFGITQKRKLYDRQFKIAAAQVVLSGEVAVEDLSAELQIKDSTLRRWADECESMGEDAFPGNGSPKVNKDCEIVKLGKRIEDLERENNLLKNFRAFLNQDRASGSGSRRSAGAISAPSKKPAKRWGSPNRATASTWDEENRTPR